MIKTRSNGAHVAGFYTERNMQQSKRAQSSTGPKNNLGKFKMDLQRQILKCLKSKSGFYTKIATFEITKGTKETLQIMGVGGRFAERLQELLQNIFTMVHTSETDTRTLSRFKCRVWSSSSKSYVVAEQKLLVVPGLSFFTFVFTTVPGKLAN